MSNIKTKAMTRTAILLSLTIAFQFLGRYLGAFIGPNNNFIVGPLVNACLIIATASVGLWSGSVVAIIAPFGAVLTGAPIPLPFIPFIAAGNFLLVLFFYLIKRNYYIGILAGAIAKSVFLFASVYFFLNLFKDTLKIPNKVAEMMFLTFSWQQLITALLGGTIALAVVKALGKNMEI
jgi:hypothetical protein